MSEKSRERFDIEQRLISRHFFAASSDAVRMQLLTLDERCNGYLDNLSTRADAGGGWSIHSIAQVLVPDARPIFGIFTVFRVQRISPPHETNHYQYFSWRQGPLSGAKGVVLIEQESVITHIVCQFGFSFAVGAQVFNLPGGFAEDNDVSLDQRFLQELAEEIGLSDASVQRILDLGVVHADPGMTNNCPRLFAAVVDAQRAHHLSTAHVNLDQYEANVDLVVIPVEQLWGSDGLIERHSHGFFGTCMARLINRGVLTR